MMELERRAQLPAATDAIAAFIRYISIFSSSSTLQKLD